MSRNRARSWIRPKIKSSFKIKNLNEPLCMYSFILKVGAALRPAFAVDTPADVTAMACEVIVLIAQEYDWLEMLVAIDPIS
jgi:hypothetical protein